MKKNISVLMAVMLMITLVQIGTNASAVYDAQYTEQAEQLNELGLFRGSDNGYELV